MLEDRKINRKRVELRNSDYELVIVEAERFILGPGLQAFRCTNALSERLTLGRLRIREETMGLLVNGCSLDL